MISTRKSSPDIFDELKSQLISYLQLCLSEVDVIIKKGVFSEEDEQRIRKEYKKIRELEQTLGESTSIVRFKKIIADYFVKNHLADEIAFPRWISPVVADCLLMIDSSCDEQTKSLACFIKAVDLPMLFAERASDKKTAVMNFLNLFNKTVFTGVIESNMESKAEIKEVVKKIEGSPKNASSQEGKETKGSSKLFLRDLSSARLGPVCLDTVKQTLRMSKN